MALKASKDRYGEIQQQFTRVRHQIYELEIESGELGKKQNGGKTARVKLESRLESTEDDRGRIAEDISQFRTQIAGLEEESTRAGGMLEQLDTERDRKVQELERAVARRKSCEEDREKTLDKIRDRKSTRLNSSHVAISYAVFCLKKKKNCLTKLDEKLSECST